MRDYQPWKIILLIQRVFYSKFGINILYVPFFANKIPQHALNVSV
jgi:hypothetical protein